MDALRRERLRALRRKEELGIRELSRRKDLYREAQALCYALVWHRDRKHNPRINNLLIRAEDRRERRGLYCWGDPHA